MKTFFYIINGKDPRTQFPEPEAQKNYYGQWGTWIKELMSKKAFVSALPLTREKRIISKNGITAVTAQGGDIAPAAYGFLDAKNIDEATELLMKAPLTDAASMIEVAEVENMPGGVLK